MSVGPPLSARVPSTGSSPTRLLLTPSIRPPEPPEPIRLKTLERLTEPAMSSAGASGPVPLVLADTMVLKRITVPPATLSRRRARGHDCSRRS